MNVLNPVSFSIHSVTETIFSVFLKFLNLLFLLLIIPRLELYTFKLCFQRANNSMEIFDPHSVDMKSLYLGNYHTGVQV